MGLPPPLDCHAGFPEGVGQTCCRIGNDVLLTRRYSGPSPLIQIGVDELFQAKGRWWCHLLCDDFSPAGLEALHRFAAQIGLPRRAFHDPNGQPRPHYDCTPEMREQALQHGALPLTRQQLVEYLQRGRSKIAPLAEPP